MAVQQIFYATQEDLVIWNVRQRVVTERERFAATDDGMQAFAAWLRRARAVPTRFLVDVIEEEFDSGTIPSLPRGDRNALLERRLSRKYSRTPYRLAQVHRRRTAVAGEQPVFYCAVSNDQLLKPWLEEAANARYPLSGVTSVPLVAPRVLAKLGNPKGNVLLLSQHQGERLRLVYLRDGRLVSARLSQVPPAGSPEYRSRVLAEVKKSRRYLERARLLRPDEPVQALFVAPVEIADGFGGDAGATDIRVIAPEEAAQALGMRQVPAADRLEMLYVFAATQRTIGRDYASSATTRDYRILRLRQAAVGVFAAGTLASAAATGFSLSSSAELRAELSTIEKQTRQLQRTFQREHETFSASQAKSHEMKAAVDTADFIRANRVLAASVLQELGSALTEFPELRIAELEWRVADGAQPTPARQPAAYVELRRATELAVELTGEIAPFDGNLNHAFATVDRFAATLNERTAFAVAVVDYPLDVRPTATVSGEFGKGMGTQTAPFRLALRMIPQEVTDEGA